MASPSLLRTMKEEVEGCGGLGKGRQGWMDGSGVDSRVPEELDMMREEGRGEPCRDVAPLHWSHSLH